MKYIRYILLILILFITISIPILAESLDDKIPDLNYNYRSNNSYYAGGAKYVQGRKTKDGGYILAGKSNGGLNDNNKGKYDAALIKLDKNLNKIWDVSYGGASDDAFSDVIELGDGSFVASGFKQSREGSLGNGYAFATKFDKDGKFIWTITWDNTSLTGVKNIMELSDGNLLLSTNVSRSSDLGINNSYNRATAIKVDSSTGDIIWINQGNGNSSDYYEALELENEDIVLIGWDRITRIDKDGNFIEGSKVDSKKHFNDIKKDKDGNILILGYDEQTTSGFIKKYDSSFNLLNENEFEKSVGGGVLLDHIIINNDGSYTIIGGIGSFRNTPIHQTGLIIELDKNLVLKSYNQRDGNGNAYYKDEKSSEIIFYDKISNDYQIAFTDTGMINIADYVPEISISSKVGEVHINDSQTDKNLINLFGITASDKEEGDITNLITVDQSSVYYSNLGEYEVNFNVKDSSDAASWDGSKKLYENKDSVTVKLKVINDKPIINADGEKYSTLGKVLSDDELKTLFNVKANDYEDGDLTSKVVVDSSAVDFNKIGDYNITFTVSDSLGETANVTVVLHITNEKPIISADDKHQGHINEVISDDDLLKLFNVSATDLEDGYLTSKIIIDSSAVDFNTEGTYEIILTVTDSDGNKVEKKVSIEIVADMDPELNSDDSKEVEEGNPLSDDEIKQLFNVNGNDYEDGDLTSNVVVDQSKVDYNTPGEYEIKFYIIDSYGNKVEKLVTLKIIKSSKPISPDKPKDDNKVDSKDRTSNDKLIQTGMYLNINLIIISLLSIIVIRRTSRV